MRDVFCRGKRVDNGNWVEGNFVNIRGRHFIISPFDEVEHINPIGVFANSVSQRIGIKDKNGKEIYEGDIVSSEISNDGLQHVDTIYLGWAKTGEYGFCWSRSGNIITEQDLIDKRYLVIGNIFEDEELI